MDGEALTKAWLVANGLEAAWDKLRRYAELVAAANAAQNLTAWQGPVFWTKGIYYSLVALTTALGNSAGRTFVDIGSGAGVPALPYLIAHPDVKATLLEPRRKRYEFLRETISALNLPNVRVQMSRAEMVVKPQFDIVTAQAVAPLHELLAISYHLGRPGATFVFFKGAALNSELSVAAPVLKALQIAYQVLTIDERPEIEQKLFVFNKRSFFAKT